MHLTMRWFGEEDLVTLAKIRQVPAVKGVVTGLYDLAPGTRYTKDQVSDLKNRVEEHDLALSVIESIPVPEDIKLGNTAARDRLADVWAENVMRFGEAGVPVICYNFMPIFDWYRTDLMQPLADASTTQGYAKQMVDAIDLSKGLPRLTAWADVYDGPTLLKLRDAYIRLGTEGLWENLQWFLERVVSAAESANVKLAIHPDDPPWSIFGIPRIITDDAALQRFTKLVDRPANGITFCTGSLGCLPSNDLPAMIRKLSGRIHFAHCRNVKVTGPQTFHEVAHPSTEGDVNMKNVLQALKDSGFNGPMRSDHGRMIWGETGRSAYGLYDRALGTMYLSGIWEGIGGPLTDGYGRPSNGARHA